MSEFIPAKSAPIDGDGQIDCDARTDSLPANSASQIGSRLRVMLRDMTFLRDET